MGKEEGRCSTDASTQWKGSGFALLSTKQQAPVLRLPPTQWAWWWLAPASRVVRSLENLVRGDGVEERKRFANGGDATAGQSGAIGVGSYGGQEARRRAVGERDGHQAMGLWEGDWKRNLEASRRPLTDASPLKMRETFPSHWIAIGWMEEKRTTWTSWTRVFPTAIVI
jgi:hypothetical protein